MLQKFSRFLLLLACLGLTGCKTYIATDIYASDALSALEGKEAAAVMLLGLPTISDQDCQKNAANMEGALARQITGVKFVRCKNVDFDSYAEFSAQIPLIKAGSPTTGIMVTAEPGRFGTHLKLVMPPDLPTAIWNSLPDDMTSFQNFEFQPILEVTFHNDIGAPIEAVVDTAFVSDVAYFGLTKHSIPHRESASLRLSDVASGAFARVGAITAIHFAPQTN